MIDIKPKPNRARQIAVLRAMTPAQRLEKSFELTEFSRRLMKDGIRRRNPHATEQEIHQIFLDRMLKYQRHKTSIERRISGAAV